jgi:tetratricopeptide (TPR) repeat protein
VGTTTTGDRYERALALFEGGDYQACRELVLEELAEHPKDVGLLRLAGKASTELDLDDAATYLQQAVAAEPENVDAWRELAEAFLYRNRLTEAMEAIRQAVELRPEESEGLIDLGLSAYAAGQHDEALAHLNRAVEREPGNPAPRRALIEVYRAAGKPEDALKAAEHLLQLEPDDVLATLDAAELNLALGRPENAVAEYSRLGAIDDDPEHEIFAYHGMIQGEIMRNRWRRALDLAIEATRVDRYGRTTDLLAFVVAEVFGRQTDRPAPTRGEIDEALAASQAEHRRLHTEESLVF